MITNLERKYRKGLISTGNRLCVVAHVCKYGNKCEGKSCDDCEFYRNIELIVEALIEEHEVEETLPQFDKGKEEVTKPFEKENDLEEKTV
ncbi:hypothetical protein KB151_003912, partial [[Clostridium] innocuum]|nr:hypothetical protein [[Clostridium] innocuum]